MISTQVPIKYRNPGCPTISIIIGNCNTHRALLDHGASASLLPFMMHERLRIGELKLTKMILQLTDHSTTLPRGMIEDVLIKVT